MIFSRFARIGLLTTFMAAMSAEAFAFSAVSATALNVRSGPGTSHGVVDALHAGQTVNVTVCRSSGWCEIRHNGPNGWVSARYLNQTGKPASSDSGDAAAAAAFAAFLGLGTIVSNNAIGQNNRTPGGVPNNTQPNTRTQQPLQARPDQSTSGQSKPGQLNCPTGQTWSQDDRACILARPTKR